MGRKDSKINPLSAAFILIAVIFSVRSLAQGGKDKDEYVRLVKASSVQIITDDEGKTFRKAVDALFLHNNTYLKCDTAFWRVDENVINAKGNVSLSQEGTKLVSQTLDYFVDDNLAQFRGGVVQLTDQENNTLRTHFLDYNTADSVALFFNGAAMKDKDGQIIESSKGRYDSKAQLFTFEDNVNMFTDSIFIRTNLLDYHSDNQLAVFNSDIDFWKDAGMLSAGRGHYDRRRETFFFTRKVHGTNQSKEAWCDSLYYYRLSNDIEMFGRVQMQDSLNSTTAVSNYMHYEDSLARVSLRKEAAVAIVSEQNNVRDTLYFGADTLIYYTMPMCDIPAGVVSSSKSRLSEIMVDPVGEYRKKAAEAAAEAAAKAKEEAAGKRPELKPQNNDNKAAATDRKAAAMDGKSGAAAELSSSMPDSPGQKSRKASENTENPGPAKQATPETVPADAETLSLTNVGGGEMPADSTLSANSALAAPVDSTLAAESTHTTPADSLAAAADNTVTAADSSKTAATTDNTLTELENAATAAADREMSEAAPADSTLTTPADSTLTAPADSTLAAVELPDSTKIGFAIGLGNVKVFRHDIQVLCDSLRYTDLDSIARFYKDPVIWNEENRQYFSDSLAVLIRDQKIDRASLMSNAFVITQEDATLYDQIKSAEIMAYFDSTSALKRFDALGGAMAIFYLEENGSIATVNKVECKMLSGNFVNGNLDRVYYYDAPKNDGYPLVQFPKQDRELKGFRWRSEDRPKGKQDITNLEIRPSERAAYEARPKTDFKQTAIYFPGYMRSVKAGIDARNAAKNKKNSQQAELDGGMAQKDSLQIRDSLAVKDSLAVADSLAVRDSLATKNAADSLQQAPKSKAELAREKREAKRKEREAKREARWAELDKRDAEKAAAKEAKKAARRREKTKRELQARMKEKAKEEKLLQYYIDYYQKRKAKEDGKSGQ